MSSAADFDPDLDGALAKATNRDAKKTRFWRSGDSVFSSMSKGVGADRAALKLLVQEREFESTSISTQLNYYRAWNRFQWFRKNTLGADDNDTPTALQIEQFLSRLPLYIRSRLPSGIPSYENIKGHFVGITNLATLKFEHFTLSAHGKACIHNVFRKHLREQTITKEGREKFWVTSTVVVRMLDAVLDDAMVNGTPSWDYVVQGYLLCSMQSATSARIGDIVLNFHDSKVPERKHVAFLMYKDVDLWMERQEASASHVLRGKVTLRYTKYKKDNATTNNDVFELREIETDAFRSCDTLCLLVAWALRSGMVPEKDWASFKARMIQQPGRKVQWLKPDQPVFHALDTAKMPKLGMPMTTDTAANTFLRWAADLAGITSVLRTHDLRRGAAMENARISKETASVALGYATTLVDDYIGKVADPTMGTRLEASTASPPVAKNDIVDDVVTRPRRNRKARATGAEIDQVVRDEGLAATDNGQPKPRTTRARASRHNTKDKKKLAKAEANVRVAQNTLAMLQSGGVASGSNHAQTSGADSIPDQPAELDLEEFVSGGTVTCGFEGVIDKAIDHEHGTKEPMVPITRDAFIQHLCSINLVYYANGFNLGGMTAAKKARYVGNSRDPPNNIIFHCPNEAFGCKRKTDGWCDQVKYQKHLDGCNESDRIIKAKEDAEEKVKKAAIEAKEDAEEKAKEGVKKKPKEKTAVDTVSTEDTIGDATVGMEATEAVGTTSIVSTENKRRAEDESAPPSMGQKAVNDQGGLDDDEFDGGIDDDDILDSIANIVNVTGIVSTEHKRRAEDKSAPLPKRQKVADEQGGLDDDEFDDGGIDDDDLLTM